VRYVEAYKDEIEGLERERQAELRRIGERNGQRSPPS
jgi:hypothetical protein